MPDFTMASAIPRTSSSLTLQPNLFQEFHPIGGVSARPLETALSCANAIAANSEKTIKASISAFFIASPAQRTFVSDRRPTEKYVIAGPRIELEPLSRCGQRL